LGIGAEGARVGCQIAHDRERDAFFEVCGGACAHRQDSSFELLAGALANALAQDDRRGRVQRLELVEDAGALGDHRAARDQQRPDRGENPAPSRGRDALPTEHALGGGERVDPVGLPSPPVLSSRTLYLEDRVAGVLKVLVEARAPTAGALKPEHELSRVDEALGPALHLAIAGRGRRGRELAEQLPDLVEHDGVVAFLVGVYPDCNHRVLLIVGDVEAAGQSCVE